MTCWARWERPRPITGRRRAFICWPFSRPSGRVRFWRRSRFRSRGSTDATTVIAFALAWIVPSWLVFEARADQAAALRHAALSGDCHCHRHGDLPAFVGPHRPFARARDRPDPVHSARPYGCGSSPAPPGFRQHIAVSRAAGAGLVGGCGLLCMVAVRRARCSRASGRVSPRPLPLSSASSASGQHDLHSLKLSPRLAEVARNLACANPRIGTLGYREPSLVFLVGTELEMLESGSEASEFLKQGGCRLVFVEKRFEEAFRRGSDRLGLQPDALDPRFGFQYQQRAAARYRSLCRAERSIEAALGPSQEVAARPLTNERTQFGNPRQRGGSRQERGA